MLLVHALGKHLKVVMFPGPYHQQTLSLNSKDVSMYTKLMLPSIENQPSNFILKLQPKRKSS